MKKSLRMMVLFAFLSGAGNANAGIPVIDATANGLKTAFDLLTQTVKWVKDSAHQALVESEWVKQLTAMKDQYDKLQEQVDITKGITDLASIKNSVEDKAAWSYLPDDYNTVVNDGVGSSAGIVDFIKAEAGLTSSELLESNQKQAAINRALGDLAYEQASNRRAKLQSMLDTIETTVDPKEKEDLQSRILAEQTMLQNEQIKLSSIQILTRAQEQLDVVRKKQQIVKKLETSFTDFGAF